MTLRTVLLSLQALLSAAEPDDPQDAVVASQYKENHDMFALTAKHWTNAYAGGQWKFLIHKTLNFKYISLKAQTGLPIVTQKFNVSVIWE